MKLTNNEVLYVMLRTKMPYQIAASIESDYWDGVNRDYKPLINDLRFEQSDTHKYLLRPYSYTRTNDRPAMQLLGEEYVLVYLYNDGNAPWKDNKCLSQYLHRYNEIQTHEGRMQLFESDDFIRPQLEKENNNATNT